MAGGTMVFKTKHFERFARKEGIGDSTLRVAVNRAEKGQIDADLGGGLIKQRVARPGEGKSGGYRTVLVFRQGALAVFVRGFAKSERENITAAELKALKDAARVILGLPPEQIAAQVERGNFVEVKKG